MVRSWIAKCKNEHQHCIWPQPKPLPTRVIDVGGSVEEEPYLLETQQQIGQWVTLSYSCGKNLPFKTTINTLDKRKKGFAKHELSALLSDAIELVGKLNIRYLWIDALCIVQDSPDD
jgi:hypothetical protein